jgi:hypothetical protein
MSEKKIPEGYMEDAQGRLVPVALVNELEREQDALVRDLCEKARLAAVQVRLLKEKMDGDIEAFCELCAEKYGATIGGKRGNIQMSSYDGRLRVVRAHADRIEFGPELAAARSLIEECIAEWSQGARPEIVTLVQDAFREDKAGRLSAARILGLRRIEIDDARWQRAMQAISDAVRVTGSADYLRFHERDDSNSPWRQIALG